MIAKMAVVDKFLRSERGGSGVGGAGEAFKVEVEVGWMDVEVEEVRWW